MDPASYFASNKRSATPNGFCHCHDTTSPPHSDVFLEPQKFPAVCSIGTHREHPAPSRPDCRRTCLVHQTPPSETRSCRRCRKGSQRTEAEGPEPPRVGRRVVVNRCRFIVP